MNDEEVQAMNRRIALGWQPTTHMWKVVAQRAQSMDSTRNAKVWGIKVSRRVHLTSYKKMNYYEVVANPQFFHPKSITAQGLTYDEAQALIKLMES